MYSPVQLTYADKIKKKIWRKDMSLSDLLKDKGGKK
jgi:hypothetical protein